MFAINQPQPQKKMKLITTFILLLAWAITANASNYYVSTTGNDANTVAQAKSPSTPWKTITKAGANVIAGDVVHVAPGTYSYTSTAYQAIKTSRSGTSAARIKYVADTKWGAKLLGKGTTVVWQNSGSYVDIVGFDISGDGRGGIFNSASNVKIIGNRVHDIAGPVLCSADPNGGAGIVNTNYKAYDNDIIGNVVHDIGKARCGTTYTIHGIYHSNLRGHVSNNISYNNSSYGIHTWHAPKDVVISNNLTFGNGEGGIIVGAGDAPGGVVADGFIVTNNIAINNGYYGIVEEGSTGVNAYKNNLVYGNKVAGFRLKNGNTHQGTITSDPYLLNYNILLNFIMGTFSP